MEGDGGEWLALEAGGRPAVPAGQPDPVPAETEAANEAPGVRQTRTVCAALRVVAAWSAAKPPPPRDGASNALGGGASGAVPEHITRFVVVHVWCSTTDSSTYIITG